MSRVAVPITMANQLPVVGTTYEKSPRTRQGHCSLREPIWWTILVGMEEGGSMFTAMHSPRCTLMTPQTHIVMHAFR